MDLDYHILALVLVLALVPVLCRLLDSFQSMLLAWIADCYRGRNDDDGHVPPVYDHHSHAPDGYGYGDDCGGHCDCGCVRKR